MVSGTIGHAPTHQVEQPHLERRVIGNGSTGAVSEDAELGDDRRHRGGVVPHPLHSVGGELFVGADRSREIPAVNEEVADSQSQ
jgi:hypothetical protein